MLENKNRCSGVQFQPTPTNWVREIRNRKRKLNDILYIIMFVLFTVAIVQIQIVKTHVSQWCVELIQLRDLLYMVMMIMMFIVM